LTVISHTEVKTNHAAAPTASYSQAIASRGLVTTAGQVGADAATGRLASGLAAQVEQAIQNLQAVLHSAGLDLNCVMKTTCYLANIADFQEFDAVYRKFFAQPYPARSTVGVALAGELLFEIEAWALAPEATA
jgi:2-iminobutanoate/2-iminopropanoate deaminase